MGYSIIPLDSYTAAVRAKRYLGSKGISVSVEKISSDRRGCRFGIRTSDPPGMVCDMLSDIGIRCGSSMPVPPPKPPRPPRPQRPPRRPRR